MSNEDLLLGVALEMVSDSVKLISLANAFVLLCASVFFVLTSTFIGDLDASDAGLCTAVALNFLGIKALILFLVLDPTYEIEVGCWLVWFSFQTFIKTLSTLGKRRLERVAGSATPAPASVHRNTIALLTIVLALNVTVTTGVSLLVAPVSFHILALLLADAATSAIHSAHTLARYAIYLKDEAHSGNWEGRADAGAYVDFACDVSSLVITLAHLAHVWAYNASRWGVSVGIVDIAMLLHMRSSLAALATRWKQLRGYMALNRALDASFPDATPEEVALAPEDAAAWPASDTPRSPTAASTRDCSICLEPMSAGHSSKKLPHCGHCFHRVCLRRWLFDGHDTCPLCRQGLTPEARAVAAAASAAAAARGARGDATGPAAPPQAAAAAAAAAETVAPRAPVRPPAFIFGGDVGLDQNLLRFDGGGGGWFPRFTIQYGAGPIGGGFVAAGAFGGRTGLRAPGAAAMGPAAAAGAPPSPFAQPEAPPAAGGLPAPLAAAYANLLEMFPTLSPAALRTHLLTVARGNVEVTAEAALTGELPPITPEEEAAREDDARRRREAEDEATRRRAAAAAASLSPAIGARRAPGTPLGEAGSASAASVSGEAHPRGAVPPMTPMSLSASGPAWLAAYDADEEDEQDAEDEAASVRPDGQFDDMAAALRALARKAGIAVKDLPHPDPTALCDARKAAMIRHGRRMFKQSMKSLAQQVGLTPAPAPLRTPAEAPTPISLGPRRTEVVASSLPAVSSAGHQADEALLPASARQTTTSLAVSSTSVDESGAAPGTPGMGAGLGTPSTETPAEARARRLAAIERRFKTTGSLSEA